MILALDVLENANSLEDIIVLMINYYNDHRSPIYVKYGLLSA